jgi:hypothetical protein
MTTQEFAAKLKQTYPEYQSMDDATLVQKVVTKYPVYKDQIQDTPTEVQQPKKDGIIKKIASNVIQPALSPASKIAELVTPAVTPIAKEAAKTLLVQPAARTAEAVTRTAFPESQATKGYEAMSEEGQPQNIGGFEVPQVKAFGEGGGKQIAGEALNAATYLVPYGKVAGVAGKVAGKTAGQVAAGALGGYTQDVAQGLTEGESVPEAVIPGAGTAIGAAIPLAPAALKATGRLTSKAGSKLVEAAIPTSSREAKILQAYKAEKPFFSRVADVLKGTEKAPQTAGKTAVKTSAGQSINGLFGTKSQIGVQSKRASKSLWEGVINPRLEASPYKVDLPTFFEKKAQDIITENSDLSRQKVLLEALDSIKEDYAGVGEVSLSQLQKFKEGWAKFVPEKAYKEKPITGAFNDVRNSLVDEARTTIYDQLGDDIKQAYFDYGNLVGLQEMGQVAMTGSKLKGGAGSFISELASQAITPVATVGGQVVYKLGNGLEVIGKAGANTLGALLGIKSAKAK